MKKNFRFLAMAVVAMAAAVFTGCSSDDDFLAPYEESAIQTRAISSTNALIDFDNVPSSVMASDQYGNNLYSATANGKQVTTGYITQIGQTGTYIQFPINYLEQEWVSGQPWEYANYKYNEEVFAFILLDDISICMQQRRRNIAGRDIASCH